MVEALKPLMFVVLPIFIKLAKQHRHDPWWCVVAQAMRKVKGVIDVKVTATQTIIWFADGRIVRYRTPPELREALTYWDRTGEWKLKSGTYALLPPLPSQTRKAQRRYAKAAKKRFECGVWHVYGPREGKKRAINARQFFGCFKKAA